MKNITINKRTRVENQDAEMLTAGIVALQMVEFVIDFFGNEVIVQHDTKIMNDGRQFVIDGCGFIAEGFEVH